MPWSSVFVFDMIIIYVSLPVIKSELKVKYFLANVYGLHSLIATIYGASSYVDHTLHYIN